MEHLTPADLEAVAATGGPGPLAAPEPGGCLVVDLRDEPGRAAPAGLAAALRPAPRVLAGITGTSAPPAPGTLAHALDVAVADDDAAEALDGHVAANPLAAGALALLLRGAEERTVDGGLLAESATYSLLQAGPEHAAWLAGRARRPPRDEPDDPVLVGRDGDRLTVTLNRPHVRNAFSAAVREALLDALAVAAADPTVRRVVLRGAGPSFCSGGDLDEFGTAADPATAHLVRTARSAGRLLATLADRTEVVVHGACVGAGVELPAFAGRVVARPSATFRLPELAMGLVPGAGGTVGVPRRIGRHRAAWLALTGATIDAPTALRWGLVDAVAPDDDRQDPGVP